MVNAVIESDIPNPVKRSPELPPTPMIIIIKFFLNLKIFLNILLKRKGIIFHNGLIRSKMIFFPGLGALSKNSCAGTSFNKLNSWISAMEIVVIKVINDIDKTITGLKPKMRFGMQYSV